ncbi:hypothetical protein SEUCBS139899_002373 [Sporothrix eucalyptigena]|uniref:Sister chromatid cohesion protein DCC1 n=1 Tax=Sporothrix eucalyptigena TaxID=1812306 RepID=A0ABP0B2J0_9PEZI
MSTQDLSAAVPLVHASDGIGYRLIELPAELIDNHSEWSLSSSADGLARLQAAGKTYALRQKNTSNALVLLKTTGPMVSLDPGSLDARPAVSAIATVHETVELVEEKEPTSSETPKPTAAPARGKWHEKFGRTR